MTSVNGENRKLKGVTHSTSSTSVYFAAIKEHKCARRTLLNMQYTRIDGALQRMKRTPRVTEHATAKGEEIKVISKCCTH